MYNFVLMEYQIEEALARTETDQDRELAVYLAELKQEKRSVSFRRRIAGAIVGFALRLDPEAINVSPRPMALEGFNVRD